MKRLVFLVVLLCAAPVSADNWWDSDETRALNRINSSLDDISWEMWRNNLYAGDSLGSYSGGGYLPYYYPVYRQPTVKQLRKWNSYQTRLQRAAANRAKRGW